MIVDERESDNVCVLRFDTKRELHLYLQQEDVEPCDRIQVYRAEELEVERRVRFLVTDK